MNKQWFKHLCQPTIPAPLLIIIIVIMTMQSSKAADFHVEQVGKGPAVILIPGLMSDDRVWQSTVDALKHRYEFHLISIAGFAGTPAVSAPSLTRVKDQLLDYIEQQQLIRPAIIGHSLGGFLSFWLASNAPDKIGPIISVDGLPFIGPIFTQNHRTSVADLKPQAEQIKQMYSNLLPQQLILQAQSSLSIQAKQTHHRQQILEMAGTSDPKTVGEAMHTLMTTDLRNDLSAIKQPVLLLGASGAFSLPEQHQHAKTLYQQQLTGLHNATVIMNSKARHFIMFDDPDWLTASIQSFLTDSIKE